MKPVTWHDVETLGRTIDGEAEDQPLLAQQGVAYCIKKRADLAAAYVAKRGAEHPEYGDGSIASACLKFAVKDGKKEWQFDCWIEGSADYRRITAKTLDDRGLQGCLGAALDVLLARVPDPTNGATHYWDDSIAPPPFAKGLPYLSIARLKFVDCA